MDFEEQSTVPGSVPEYGAIFMSNNETRRECLRKKVFGLPSSYAYFVEHVKVGMVLFLFEFERRELHGVFLACSDGAMDIVPHAFSSIRKQFPAQVKFSLLWDCKPLSEKEFREAIRENYYSQKKFSFGLSEPQVRELLYLFSKKRLEGQGPPRQLIGGRLLRGRGHANYRLRQVASSDRHFRNAQVTSGCKRHNLGQTFPTMRPEYNCNYERSIGTSNRKEQAVSVGSIDERDCGHSHATNVNFGYEHQEDSPLAPDFSDAYFEDPLKDVGLHVDPRGLGAVSGSLDKKQSLETPVGLSLPAEYPLDNYARAPEDMSIKGNDWFEGEDYKENDSILQQSRGFPSYSSWKLNPSPHLSKYSLEDNSFKYDPAVPLKTFHAAKPVSSMLSQHTLYGDAVVTTTLPYDSDAPYLHNHNSPSLGIMQCLGSFPASDNSHTALAVPTGNQSVPSYSSSWLLTDVGIRSSNCTTELYDKRNDSKISSLESPSYKFRATEPINEAFEDFSYMDPSLPCTFSETIQDMVKSEKLWQYAAQHELLGPSVNSNCHSSASRSTSDQTFLAYGRNVEFQSDGLILNEYQGSFVKPKSLALHRNNSLSPAVLKDLERSYSDHQQGSVFSRLSLAPKVQKHKKYHSLNIGDKLDTSVDEVMAMLHHNNQCWGKERRKLLANVNPTESFNRKQEAVFSFKETPHLSESTLMKMETEGNSEIDDNKSDNTSGVPFVNFRRRNRATKNLCDRKSGGSNRIAQETDPSVGQQKRRKLVRPNFSKNEACGILDTFNSFQIEKVSQVHPSPSHILTRTMEDSIHHDNENKVAPVAVTPQVRYGICTVDENFGSESKRGKVLSSEQQKWRRRLIRPNFDKSKKPQEREMDHLVSQVNVPPSHILTRTMVDSIHHDNENKVSPVAGLPDVRHDICTVDENFSSQTKQGKLISSEQQKRRRLVRPNFEKIKEPQEREMDLAAKMEPAPVANCSNSEDNIGSAMVSVDCVNGDTSQDGKVSLLFCSADPKNAIVDSQKQTIVSPGACFVTNVERNVFLENGCAQSVASFTLGDDGDKSKELLIVGEQRSVESVGYDRSAGHLITSRTEDVSNAKSADRHVDEESNMPFVQDSPSCETSRDKHKI